MRARVAGDRRPRRASLRLQPAASIRRYHGLLFLSGRDPGDRFLAVSKLEDRFEDGDSFWELSSNVYPWAFHPDGTKNLLEFRRYPFPSFLYRVGKRVITKEVFMAYGTQGVFCVYRLRGEVRDSSRPILRIRPLLNKPYYHHTGERGLDSSSLALDGRSCPGALPRDLSVELYRVLLSLRARLV